MQQTAGLRMPIVEFGIAIYCTFIYSTNIVPACELDGCCMIACCAVLSAMQPTQALCSSDRQFAHNMHVLLHCTCQTKRVRSCAETYEAQAACLGHTSWQWCAHSVACCYVQKPFSQSLLGCSSWPWPAGCSIDAAAGCAAFTCRLCSIHPGTQSTCRALCNNNYSQSHTLHGQCCALALGLTL